MNDYRIYNPPAGYVCFFLQPFIGSGMWVTIDEQLNVTGCGDGKSSKIIGVLSDRYSLSGICEGNHVPLLKKDADRQALYIMDDQKFVSPPKLSEIRFGDVIELDDWK